jgi:hypothetical protein
MYKKQLAKLLSVPGRDLITKADVIPCILKEISFSKLFNRFKHSGYDMHHLHQSSNTSIVIVKTGRFIKCTLRKMGFILLYSFWYKHFSLR